MTLILFNLLWMSYNVSLACIAVIFGWLTYETESKLLKFIYGIIWILFLPNTIYLLTDIGHFFEDVAIIQSAYKPLLILEYTLLMLIGIGTFLFAMYPFEILLKKSKKKFIVFEHNVFFIGMNFLVAFGMVLGRVQRTNSWDVVFNIKKVALDSFHVLTTTELLLLFLFFGILCNVIYFPLRSLLRKYEKNFYR